MMKKLKFLTWIAVFLISVSFYTLPNIAISGTPNDAILDDIAVSPDPVQAGSNCNNALSAKLRSNGDDVIPPGAIKISFSYRDANASQAQMTPIGDLTVNYDPNADGPFAITRVWPDDFPSATNKSLNWQPPINIASFLITANAQFIDPSKIDSYPGNNLRPKTFSAVNTLCQTTVEPIDCAKHPAMCPKPCVLFPDLCKPQVINICKTHPNLCNPICIGPGCNKICPGCPPLPDPCPDCPIEFNKRDWVELLSIDTDKTMFIRVVNQAGETIATMKALQKPLTIGKQTFYQGVRFKPEQNAIYNVVAIPAKGSKKKVNMKSRIFMRNQRAFKGAVNIEKLNVKPSAMIIKK